MRAIVLGGGGSKGAYEIGVWKAILELGISYDIVTGTSIGAINGALMVQQDFSKAERLWRHLSVDDIIANGINLDFNIDDIIEQLDKLKPFLDSYLTHNGMDITPLLRLIKENIDEKKILDSKIQYGLVTLEVPSLITHEMIKQEMGKDLCSYVLASASCFPAFPVCQIHDKYFIDGGYVDNVPIHLAKKLGADDIIAVTLRYEEGVFSNFDAVEKVHMICPSWNLGSFLDFDSNVINHNLDLGYFDVMKYFNRYDGYRYTFYKENKENYYKVGKLFYDSVQNFENIYLKKALIRELLEGKISYHLSYYQFFVRGMEMCMELFSYSPYQVYSLFLIKEELQTILDDNNRDYLSILESIQGIHDIYSLIKTKGQHFLLRILYYLLKKGELHQHSLLNYCYLFPREVCVALFLRAIN